MSDELNDLKLALQTTTPVPEATRIAAHLTLAEKNFDQLQETAASQRQTFRQSKDGRFKGVKKMAAMVSNRMDLISAATLASVGLIAMFPEISAQFGLEPQIDPANVPNAVVQSMHKMAQNTSIKTDARRTSILQSLELGVAKLNGDQAISPPRFAVSANNRMQAKNLVLRPPELSAKPKGDIFSRAQKNLLRVTADVTMIQTPWNAQTQLIRIAVQAKRPDVDQPPPQLGVSDRHLRVDGSPQQTTAAQGKLSVDAGSVARQ